MLRSLSLGLLTVALFGAGSTVSAQQIDGPALPGARSFSEASSALADCADGTLITQGSATSAFGAGNTVTATGGAQELGQSFTATCDGTLDSVEIVVQNPAGAPAAQTIEVTVTVYSGESTAVANLIASDDFSFALPAASSAAGQVFEIPGDLQLTEGQVYSFFVDVTGTNNMAMQGDNTNPYAGGVLLFSGSGSPDGASPQATLDLLFEVVINAPMNTAGETFETLGYDLSAARPNPASGISRMDLTVASAQDVRMTAHDALGRQVAVLLNGPVTSTQAVSFDTAGLAPGVYIVRVAGETFTTTQRVTVVR